MSRPRCRRCPRGKKASGTSRRILNSATELFLRDGYANTNLEQVAAAAGVTKPTVYSHFGSKAGLLDAVTKAFAGKPLAGLLSSLEPSGHPRSDLLRFAETFLTTVFSEKALLWRRFAAAESLDHPEVGEAFFHSGPARVSQALADYLRNEQLAGRLTLTAPDRAAGQLMGMLLGLDLLRSQVGMSVLDPSSIEQRSREAVDLFLAAYGGQCT